MSFLQSFILWGWPLVLLPVLIHLFNRWRHRPIPWAAMMFLRSATLRSSRQSRLRQWLILLTRVAAVAALWLALSRPLAGGWMGWLASPMPDAVIVLLDRSASMEARPAGQTRSQRDQALELMARSATAMGNLSRLVVIDSVTQQAQELSGGEGLARMTWPAATGTSADIPGLMQLALDWVDLNQPGRSEIWLASDGQRSNWDPASARWARLQGAWQALGSRVKCRILWLHPPGEENVSIRLAGMKRHDGKAGGGSELELILDLETDQPRLRTLPLEMSLNGSSRQVDLAMEGSEWRHRLRVPLPEDITSGWGTISLPADANPADNQCHFVYGPAAGLGATIVAQDAFASTVLQLALAPGDDVRAAPKQVGSPAEAASQDWEKSALIVWQGNMPHGLTGDRLISWVRQGGILAMFPGADGGSWQQVGWGRQEVAAESEVFAVDRWEQTDGPWIDSEEGWALPVDELGVKVRQIPQGSITPLAWFEDGFPLLARRQEGNGQIFLCATLPKPDWSRLAEGPVLLPMLMRLKSMSDAQSKEAAMVDCGDPRPDHAEGPWLPVNDPEHRHPERQTGVYRSGRQWLAVNWAAAEADRTRLDREAIASLGQGLHWRLFEEQTPGGATEQYELWRFLLVLMAFLLLCESALILPDRDSRRNPLAKSASEPWGEGRRAA